MNHLLAPFRFARAVYHVALYLLKGRPILVPTPILRYRERQCSKCAHFAHGMCKACSCVVNLKCRLDFEQCPLPEPRWRALSSFHPDED